MSIIFYKGNRVTLGVSEEERLLAIVRLEGGTVAQAFERCVAAKAVNLILESFNESFGKPDDRGSQ